MNITLLLDAQRARTAEDFLIRDLPGTSGRLDIVCRVLISAFHTVPSLTPFLNVNAILGGPPKPPLRLSVSNVVTAEFPESELACALILKGLLQQFYTTARKADRHWPQFQLTPKSFEDTLDEIAKPTTQLLYLIEDGIPLEKLTLNLQSPIALILGDDKGLPVSHEKYVYQHAVQEVSIGTRSLLGSHVISLFLLDLEQRTKIQPKS
ncbi:MAG: hypothetical protein ACFFD8_06690 [Candidatus Thorarchaeota archaeon]